MFKPRVAQGGQEDRKQLLSRARKQREERQRVKVLTSSVVVFQKYTRGWLARKRAKQVHVTRWDRLWETYKQDMAYVVAADNKTKARFERQPTYHALFASIPSWFQLENPQHERRLITLCALLKSSLNTTNLHENYFHCAYTKVEVKREDRERWAVQTIEFAALLLDHMYQITKTKQVLSTSKQTLQIYNLLLSTLRLITDPEQWPGPQKKKKKAKKKANNNNNNKPELTLFFQQHIWNPLCFRLKLYARLHHALTNLLTLQVGTEDASKETKRHERALVTALVNIALKGVMSTPTKQQQQQQQQSVPFERVFVGRILSLPTIAFYIHESTLKTLRNFTNSKTQKLLSAVAQMMHIDITTTSQQRAASEAAEAEGKMRRKMPWLRAWEDCDFFLAMRAAGSHGISPHLWLLGNIIQLFKQIGLQCLPIPLTTQLCVVLTTLLQRSDGAVQRFIAQDEEDTDEDETDLKNGGQIMARFAHLRHQLRLSMSVVEAGTHQFWGPLFHKLFQIPHPPELHITPFLRAYLDSHTFQIRAVTAPDITAMNACLLHFVNTQGSGYVEAVVSLHLTCLRKLNLATAQDGNGSVSILSFSSPIVFVAWWFTSYLIRYPLTPTTTTTTTTTTISTSASSTTKKLSKKVLEKRGKIENMCRLKWVTAILTSHSVDAGFTCDVFELFLRCYQPLLLVLDDVEFRYIPFGPHILELRQVTRVLKTVLFHCLWNSTRATLVQFQPVKDHKPFFIPLSAQITSLRVTCRRVLAELYRRDVRRPYLSEFDSKDDALHEAETQQKRAARVSLPGKMWNLLRGNTSGASDSKSYSTLALDALGEEWLLGTADQDWMQAYKDWQQVLTSGEPPATASLSATDRRTRKLLLSIVTAMPYIVTFQERVSIFRALLTQERIDNDVRDVQGHVEFKIRRNHEVADALTSISQIGAGFKYKVKIKFIDVSGREEKGIDMGGPFKEFLEIISHKMFDYGVFTSTEKKELFPNPAYRHIPDSVELLTMIGRVVGKSILEGNLLDVTFASFFLSKVLKHNINLEAFQSYDAELHKNLLFMLTYEGDVEDLCVSFAITEEELGAKQTYDLKYDGRNIDVTNANKVEYVFLVVDYYLNRRLAVPTDAFLRGLYEMVDVRWLELFNPFELQVLISGDANHEIDVYDWQAHTEYDNCTSMSASIKVFWKVVKVLTQSERRDLLKFTTGCSRPPLAGFSQLLPRFRIRLIPTNGATNGSLLSSVFSRPSNGRLPSAATCFNTLKLPAYTSTSLMAQKLKLAIQNNQGFELS